MLDKSGQCILYAFVAEKKTKRDDGRSLFFQFYIGSSFPFPRMRIHGVEKRKDVVSAFL